MFNGFVSQLVGLKHVWFRRCLVVVVVGHGNADVAGAIDCESSNF